jgi:hypothetical protein
MDTQPEQQQMSVIESIISPGDYNAIVGTVQPLKITLLDCGFKLKESDSIGEALKAKATINTAILHNFEKRNDSSFSATLIQNCHFSIDSVDDQVLIGVATYQVKISVGVEPPEAFWTLFLKRNVRLYVHPAVRELVASIAMRCNLICSPLESVTIRLTTVDSELSGELQQLEKQINSKQIS